MREHACPCGGLRLTGTAAHLRQVLALGALRCAGCMRRVVVDARGEIAFERPDDVPDPPIH